MLALESPPVGTASEAGVMPNGLTFMVVESVVLVNDILFLFAGLATITLRGPDNLMGPADINSPLPLPLALALELSAVGIMLDRRRDFSNLMSPMFDRRRLSVALPRLPPSTDEERWFLLGDEGARRVVLRSLRCWPLGI
jgi:hypothetical protein